MLNRPVAEQLGVRRRRRGAAAAAAPGTIPADSPLGRKAETVDSYRLTVGAIIPAEGLGRFDLRPTQRLPRNAYVALEWLQQRLDQAGGST